MEGEGKGCMEGAFCGRDCKWCWRSSSNGFRRSLPSGPALGVRSAGLEGQNLSIFWAEVRNNPGRESDDGCVGDVGGGGEGEVDDVQGCWAPSTCSAALGGSPLPIRFLPHYALGCSVCLLRLHLNAFRRPCASTTLNSSLSAPEFRVSRTLCSPIIVRGFSQRHPQ